MNNHIKKLLLLFIILAIVKSILSYLIPAPSAFSDEYAYAKIAQSLFESGTFSIHDIPSQRYLPLYPILLAISYAFNNMIAVYAVMKIINAFISSLIIFPIFFLAKEFFTEKRALFIALLASILPMNFAMSPYILAENLFYPLFAFAFYFTYKMFSSNNLKWAVFAGIASGLLYLTKVNGLIFPIAVIIYSIIHFIYRKEEFSCTLKKMAVFFVTAFIVALPWLARAVILSSPIGDYSSNIINPFTPMLILGFIVWFALYFGYITIASGFLLFYNPIPQSTNDNQTKIFSLFLWVIAILTIIFAVYSNLAAYYNLATYYNISPSWLSGRPIGRYIDAIIPFFILGSFIWKKKTEKEVGKINKIEKIRVALFYPLSIFFLIFSSLLVLFPLFPVNNLNLTWLGSLAYLISSFIKNTYLILAIFSLLFLFLLFLSFKVKFRVFCYLLLLLFLFGSLLNYGIIYYNSNTFWYKGENVQVGLWFNENIEKNAKVLIDEKYEGRILKTNQSLYEHTKSGSYSTIMGFWMRQDISFGSLNQTNDFDYFISKDNIEGYQLAKEIGSIKIYKLK
ncbi:glycosyltransferase family 39 protein [archaeon]|nr:glycosyltransferase family 39 protein [archaeon]